MKKGFALIELLIYFGLFAFFLPLIADLYFKAGEVNQSVGSKTFLVENGQFILFEMENNLRKAREVVLPTAGDSGSVLILDSGNISYTLSSGGLLEKAEGGEIYRLNNNILIKDLLFTSRGEAGKKPIVSLSMTLESREVSRTNRQKSSIFLKDAVVLR